MLAGLAGCTWWPSGCARSARGWTRPDMRAARQAREKAAEISSCTWTRTIPTAPRLRLAKRPAGTAARERPPRAAAPRPGRPRRRSRGWPPRPGGRRLEAEDASPWTPSRSLTCAADRRRPAPAAGRGCGVTVPARTGHRQPDRPCVAMGTHRAGPLPVSEAPGTGRPPDLDGIRPKPVMSRTDECAWPPWRQLRPGSDRQQAGGCCAG